jgi:hypothetical protein
MARSDTPSDRKLKAAIARMQRAPKFVAIPLGVGLIIGGTILAPLPVFGVWMAPLGLAVLAPHSRRAHRATRHLHRYWIMFLRWSIRNGFLRVKEPGPPPSGD